VRPGAARRVDLAGGGGWRGRRPEGVMVTRLTAGRSETIRMEIYVGTDQEPIIRIRNIEPRGWIEGKKPPKRRGNINQTLSKLKTSSSLYTQPWTHQPSCRGGKSETASLVNSANQQRQTAFLLIRDSRFISQGCSSLLSVRLKHYSYPAFPVAHRRQENKPLRQQHLWDRSNTEAIQG
jgi:hypothetical protein